MGCRPLLSPAERVLRSRIGAYKRWSQEADPRAATAPARSAFLERFVNEVDPEGRLPEPERLRRGEQLMRSYMAGLSFKSARARSKRKAASSTKLTALEVRRASASAPTF